MGSVIYIYIRVCVCIDMHILYIYIHTHKCICMYVSSCKRKCLCIRTCIRISLINIHMHKTLFKEIFEAFEVSHTIARTGMCGTIMSLKF